MNFDFSEKGKVKIDMIDYVKAMLDEFPVELKDDDTAPTPAPENLFAPSEGEDLDKSMAETYHTFTAKGLYACKRARPDTQPAIAGLCTQVKKPTTGDWDKLLRYMKYLNGARNCLLYTSPSPRDGLLSRMPSSA